MFSFFHEISIFQPKWLRFWSKPIFAVTFMIFWNILAHNFLVSHHVDLKFCREIRCNKYLKIKSKNFNISNHFGLFRPKMTENSKTAYRRPLPNWPMESVWNFQIFLCNHLLYTNMSYCAKFQPNWNSSFHFTAIYSFRRFAFWAVRAEHTAATAVLIILLA